MSTTVLTTDPPSPTLEALLAWLRQHRAAGSVHYDAQQQLWQVFGYADVLRVLTDSTLGKQTCKIPGWVSNAPS